MNLAKIEEINRLATEECSLALSKLVKEPASVTTYYVVLKTPEEVFKMIDEESPCVGVTVGVTGDVEGSIALILSKESAFCLADLLLNRERGTTRELTSEAPRALEELGNVVTGCYLRAFSKGLGTRTLLHRAPTLVQETPESIRLGLGAWLKPDEKIPFVAVLFGFKQAVVKGYVLVLFEAETLEKAGGGTLSDG